MKVMASISKKEVLMKAGLGSFQFEYLLKKCWYFERQGFSRQNVGMHFRTGIAGFKTLPLKKTA